MLATIAACYSDGEESSGEAQLESIEQPIACQITRSFKAHAPGNLNQPYSVPANGERRVCFTFANPLAANELIYGEAPNRGLLTRDWTLMSASQGVGGSVVEGPCSGGDAVIAGGLAGTGDYLFPSDVGMKISGPFIMLEVHYINNGSTYLDTSSVSFCTTTQSRPNIAGRVILGAIPTIPPHVVNYPIVGTSSNLNASSQSLYAIDMRPEMNYFGVAFRAQHSRGGVSLPDWFVGGYSYPDSAHRSLNRVEIRPGDVLRSTCVYANQTNRTVSFGPNPDNEVCWNWVTVYPISAARRN